MSDLVGKPRVYWDDAPEGFDPSCSAWCTDINYTGGFRIRQAHESWDHALRYALISTVAAEVGL